MLENLCTLPVAAHIQEFAVHPTEPLLSVGLVNGRVSTYRLPSGRDGAVDSNEDVGTSTGQIGLIHEAWTTKRHKGSCRCIAYAHDGSSRTPFPSVTAFSDPALLAAYSAGTDGVIKQFDPQSGVVASKINLPTFSRSEPVDPAVMEVLTPKTILLGDDGGSMYIFDLRENHSINPKPAREHKPHRDFITSITPLPATSTSSSGFPRQWVSTGGGRLAVSDIDSGAVATSEDQDDDLLCSVVIPTGMGPKKMRDNPVVVVGTTSGVLTLWDKGSWDDQQDRIHVTDGGRKAADDLASLEAVVRVPEALGWGSKIVVGATDGSLSMVDLRRRDVHHILNHDDIDGVVAVAFDCENRLISAGGKMVKVWQENSDITGGEDEPAQRGTKHDAEDSSESGDSADSDAEPAERKKKKKRRKGFAARGGGQAAFPGLD